MGNVEKMKKQLMDEMFECIGDAVFITELETLHILDANVNAVKRFGYTREELLRLTLEDIEFAPDEDADHLAWQSSGGSTLITEQAYRHKNGQIIPVEVSGRCIEYDGQRAWFSLVRDITPRKHALSALRESERRFRLLAENSPDTIYIFDTQKQKTVYVNRSDFLGYTQDELTSENSLLDQLHPEDLESVMRFWQRFISGEVDASAGIEYRLHSKAGDWEWVRSRGTVLGRDVDGSPTQILVTLTVITPSKRAEEELRQHHEHLEERVRARTEELTRTNVHLQMEIAERERVEAALLAAKDTAEAASQAKSAFLATMSHELRTPLTAIIGYAEMLREEAEERMGLGSFAGDLVNIRVAADQLLELVNDVLDFSQIETGHLEVDFAPTDLALVVEVCMAMAEPLMRKKNLHLEMDVFPNLPPIMADHSRLIQVFSNLLSNAAKFTPSGSVTVSAGPVGADALGDLPVHLDNAAARGKWVLVGVIDTGIGIAPEHQTIIFEAFHQVDISYTRRFGGVGLGLAIVRRLVEMMGGHIWVESELEKGSAFYVLLPVAE